jgi:hypothetical protein
MTSFFCCYFYVLIPCFFFINFGKKLFINNLIFLFLDVADSYTRIAHGLEKFGQLEAASGEKDFGRFLIRITELLEKMKKAEARVGTDEELKEADTFRYFMRETQAAKVLFWAILQGNFRNFGLFHLFWNYSTNFVEISIKI